MNISSVVITLKADANKSELSKLISELAQIMASGDDKIVALIQSDDTNGQIRIFRALENIPGVSDVAMIYNYEELDEDIKKAKNNDIVKIINQLENTPDDQIKYIQEHLYIISGFYGLLKPLDAITPYRLEMQTKCPFSLYDFWKDDLSNQIDEPILNLASEEYAKTIRKYKPLIDVRFVEENGKEKGVYAKMARGAMVRYLAENQIENIKDITQFSDLGYTFDASQSTEKNYIFKKKLSS